MPYSKAITVAPIVSWSRELPAQRLQCMNTYEFLNNFEIIVHKSQLIFSTFIIDQEYT